MRDPVFKRSPLFGENRAICSRSSMFAVVALLAVVASTHLPVWKFPPPLVSTSPHQRALLSFFFSTPAGKKKVTKDETQQKKGKKISTAVICNSFFFLSSSRLQKHWIVLLSTESLLRLRLL